MAIQSLYRRYRPGKFAELRGQDHLKLALQNAIREGTVSHAYLFSGPRGTGKTTTARLLAKALNCASVVDGEPCGECESCRSIDAGSSMDVIELDAASNNGVDAMRDLVARAALGSPGRTKLYILDEAHMLTSAASNTLLKTLEEPPGHVVFVLATTEPEKVLPTIRSRTQHFELRLLDGPTLQSHLRWVADDAKLDVDDAAIALAVRRGKGSARDALSALDQIAAAGGTGEDDTVVDEIIESLCERDTGRALVAVAQAASAGREPRQLAEAVLGHLRDALVATLAPDAVLLPDDAKELVADQGRRLGNAATVRAMDAIGEAIQQMRESPDPRVALEVALVRCTRVELDASPAALVERLERLERGGRVAAAPAAAAAAATPTPAPERPAPTRPPTERPTLGALRNRTPAAATAAPTATASASPAGGGALPSRDALTTAWADAVLPKLKPRVKGLFASGRFIAVEDGTAVFALQYESHISLAAPVKPDVEAALAAHFGVPVPLRLVVDPGGPAKEDAPTSAPDQPEEPVDLDELTDAPPDNRTGIDHLSAAFGDVEVVEDK
ncbi:MAG TPA: DNA polymerase III subunit gamma/tau [Acidimicrobiales bacterium]|nr:DNA polymerase III subunit gamma/tau [Acidimicrobiales bacterium]